MPIAIKYSMTKQEARIINKQIARYSFQSRMAAQCGNRRLAKHNFKQAEKARLFALELLFLAL